MNVYDFDQTIFFPDSSWCFFRYCLRHWPRAVLRVLPASALELVRYQAQGKKDARLLKEALFSYLNRLESTEAAVDAFWEESFEKGIADWYLRQKRDDDLIISASPEFLLRPAAARLGVRLIATPMNPYTGKISGRNCHDEEKCRRFREEYPNAKIERFYSDSLSDTPMARLAERAFLVREGRLMPWPSLPQ